MHHSWVHISREDPAVIAYVSGLCTSLEASSNARCIFSSILHVLKQPTPAKPALNQIQEALALAYTTILQKESSSDSHNLAPIMLGVAAEALIAIESENAFPIAQKLLTYANLHVAPVDLSCFRRMVQQLGQKHRYEKVLQLVHIATQHHPSVSDPNLVHARLLALEALRLDKQLEQDCENTLNLPWYSYELQVWYAASRNHQDMLINSLERLRSFGPLPWTTYALLVYACVPLQCLLTDLPQFPSSLTASEFFDELMQRATKTNSAHIPYLLALFGLQKPAALDESRSTALPSRICIALAEQCKVAISATSLALASSWCGRHHEYQLGLDVFFEAVEAAPEARPRTCVEELQPIHRRSAEHAALQQAANGVIRACKSAKMPMVAIAFAAKVIGTPSIPIPDDLDPRQVAMLRRISTAKERCVEHGSQLTASLLECAGVLRNVPFAREIMLHAARSHLKPNGRIRRALARLLLQSTEGQYTEMQRLNEDLAISIQWVGGESTSGVDPANERLAKLRQALDALGFQHETQLAHMRAIQQQNAAGARNGSFRAREASYEWVRDTSLQPASHEPWSEDTTTKMQENRHAAVPFAPSLESHLSNLKEHKASLPRETQACDPDRRTGNASRPTSVLQQQETNSKQQALAAEPSPASTYHDARSDPPSPAASHSRTLSLPTSSAQKSSRAFAARLRLCAAQGDADNAQIVFRAMLRAEIRPSVLHVLPLLQSLCRAQRTSEAQWILRVALPSWNLLPTAPMYSALITALADANDWHGVRREMHEMKRANLAVDTQLQDTLHRARYQHLRDEGKEDAMELPFPKVDESFAKSAQAVTRHFQARMQARDYLGAQQFYAECLQHGLRPTYSHRRLLKRAGNYLQKLLRNYGPDEDYADLLQKAYTLQQHNASESAFVTHPSGQKHVQRQRAYRSALVQLVRDVVAGQIEQTARSHTP
ncbi:hypothetical protein MYAM1_002677 [Malassezia yamatoensis]|uniref:PROP1-like PPR domain-containing protein n=1 Tax=Malassezia yamatoensis TaxID=253288 RepID=A0AAJ5YUD8_9BASI|nr:hypothetical protein MYAM1_002677 [Malassezia yamatoensis]